MVQRYIGITQYNQLHKPPYFSSLEVNDSIKDSHNFERLEGTLGSIDYANNHILTQFKASKVRGVVRDRYAGNNMAIQLLVNLQDLHIKSNKYQMVHHNMVALNHNSQLSPTQTYMKCLYLPI